MERREIVRKLYNRTYGCENATFTHNSRTILCSSNKDCKKAFKISQNNVLVFT